MSEVSVNEAWQAVSKGAILIDVREVSEYCEVAAKNAKLMPLATLSKEALQAIGIDKMSEVYLICRSGGRSAKACQILASFGIHHTHNVTGGTLAWLDASLPLQKD